MTVAGCVPLPPSPFPNTANMSAAERFVINSFVPSLNDNPTMTYITVSVSVLCLAHSAYLHGKRFSVSRLAVDLCSFCILAVTVISIYMNEWFSLGRSWSNSTRIVWINVVMNSFLGVIIGFCDCFISYQRCEFLR